MSRYKTVLFDADNTLFDFSRAELSAIAETLALFGIAPTAEHCARYSRINDEMWKRLERGEITKEALRVVRFVAFLEEIGARADVNAMADAYLTRLSVQTYTIAGATALVQMLAADCRLYIITNGIACVQKRRFAASPFVPYFKGLFISEEIGFEKPHPAFFAAVAAKIPDFDAKATLVVGDSLSSDMAGGVAAGLDTCWYNPKNTPNSKNLPITYTVRTLEEVLSVVRGA
ncbi:MAG: YjjG family noncanonical pyrimidine nucleotidase [Clostridia bacterium]|nr:YjjG family noncanonical pyrimidine nucleotidase [Clostridia bacterium]